MNDYEFGGEMLASGKVRTWDREAVTQDMAALYPPGTKLLFTVRPIRRKVSQRQQGFYFAAVVKTAMEGFRELGDDLTFDQVRSILETESPHTKLLLQFADEAVMAQQGLSELLRDKERFTEHIDWCIRYIATHTGHVVEDPETYLARIYGPQPQRNDEHEEIGEPGAG